MRLLKFEAIWCPGCLVMKQRFNKIDTSGIEIISYDYDIDNDIVKKYNIGNILPVIIIEDSKGIEIERIIGEQSISKLEGIINKYRIVGSNNEENN